MDFVKIKGFEVTLHLVVSLLHDTISSGIIW